MSLCVSVFVHRRMSEDYDRGNGARWQSVQCELFSVQSKLEVQQTKPNELNRTEKNRKEKGQEGSSIIRAELS